MNWIGFFPSTWNPIIAFVRLFNSESQIASKAISDIIILLIIALVLYFIGWALKCTLSSLNEIGQYLSALKKDANDSDLLKNIESSNLYLFRELSRYFIQIDARDGTNQKWTRRTVDAAEILRDSALSPDFTSKRLFQSMPGILTGLGVLGTFIGLQIGIGGLKLTDLTNLNSSIVPLIQGCAVAFSTSVWGVSASLFFSIVEKAFEGFAVQKIRKLQSSVNAAIPRYVPEEAMAELERASRETEDILKGLAVAIGDQMQQAIGRLGNEIKDAVAEATSAGQGPLMEKSAELISNAITAELANLKKQIGTMSDEFTEHFVGASSKLMDSIHHFEPTVKILSDTIGTNQRTVTEAVEKLNAHQSVMEKMALAATEIQQAAQAFHETKETMQLSADNNKRAADAQFSAAQTNERAANQFSQIGERLPEVQAVIENGARVIASISGPLASLRDYLEQLPQEQKEFQENITASNNEQTKNLLSMVNDLAEKVSGAAEEFAKVDGLASKLATAATSLDDASNELAVFGNQILDASKVQRDAADAARSAALSGERTATALEPIPNKILELNEGLLNAGNSVKSGAEAARDSYIKMFKAVEPGLSAIKDQLQSIITAYGQQVESQTRNLMEQWTSEVTKCLQSYESQVEQLKGDIETLNDLLSRHNK